MVVTQDQNKSYFNMCLQVSQWYDLVVFTASMEVCGLRFAVAVTATFSIISLNK